MTGIAKKPFFGGFQGGGGGGAGGSYPLSPLWIWTCVQNIVFVKIAINIFLSQRTRDFSALRSKIVLGILSAKTWDFLNLMPVKFYLLYITVFFLM